MDIFLKAATGGTYIPLVSTDAVTGGFMSTLLQVILPIGLMVLIFYFLIIRPQKKREKQAKDMLDAIKIGDKITTIGGIFGRVKELHDEVLTIEVGSERTQLRIARWAVRNVVGGEVANDTTVEAAAATDDK